MTFTKIEKCAHGLTKNNGCMACYMEKRQRQKSSDRIREYANKLKW